MADRINILPESVANQIAAGEVIQRPASAVKELIENAVDAKASFIKLIVKDAGKQLIQVIDDGYGMSETDARVSFERHATSKINKAEDLFSLTTKGFRGEALASVAAVAQVELRTRRPEDAVGTEIIIEGSEVKSQEPCACAAGTSISIKNLFFNIPARRNFLKSNPVESNHIIEEFQRVAMAHPEIGFSLHHNGEEIFHLEASNLRQRIIGIFGPNYNERLVPVDEETDIVKITGFIGKPQFARKTRGEQFFFINNRFIRNSYLHHAVQSAFHQLLPADSHPSYFLFLEVPPSSIDINIHPTKTEVKFEDDKHIYSILKSTVRMSLGKYNIAPTIDFEQESTIAFIPPPKGPVAEPVITVNPDFNPFKTGDTLYSGNRSFGNGSGYRNASVPSNWDVLYRDHQKDDPFQTASSSFSPQTEFEHEPERPSTLFFQIHSRYILSQIKSGLMVVHQQRAHERILFEKFMENLKSQPAMSQKLLFPETVDLTTQHAQTLINLREDLHKLGYEFEQLGGNSLAVYGVPVLLTDHSPAKELEKLAQSMLEETETTLGSHERLALSLAKSAGIKSGKILSQEEMSMLIDELFACSIPSATATGKQIIHTIKLDELDRFFRN
jgi:DNA mismatch repair protein MutL